MQDVLADVFRELLRYSDKQFEALEKRLDAQIPGSKGLYDIYTGICKRENIDSTSRCLFEMAKGILANCLLHAIILQYAITWNIHIMQKFIQDREIIKP